jgi:hypothetical protein
MELEAVGEVEDVESIDKEPVIIPIVGYDNKKKKVVTKIAFVNDVAPGVARDMIRATDSRGIIQSLDALAYLDACVHEDSREEWDALIHGTDITSETINAVYTKLGTHYANRPFTKQSGSPAGQSSTKLTTPRAAKSQASKKKVSA